MEMPALEGYDGSGGSLSLMSPGQDQFQGSIIRCGGESRSGGIRINGEAVVMSGYKWICKEEIGLIYGKATVEAELYGEPGLQSTPETFHASF